MSDSENRLTAATGPIRDMHPKLTSSSLLARNATLNLMTEGFLLVVLVAAIPKLVSHLGNSAFGLFSLAWVVVGYLAFLDIGVSTATTKFTSEYLAKHETSAIARLIRTALAANAIMGFLAGCLAVAASPLLIRYAFRIPASMHAEAFSVFVGVSFALPVLLIQGVLRAALSSYQRFDWLNLVNGSIIGLQWAVMTWLASRGIGVVTIVWIAVVARVVIDAIYALLLLRLIPDLFDDFSFSWDSLWRLLHFGAWISVSQVMSPILVYLDRMMIASLVSLQAVTIYTIPTEVFNRLGVVPACLMATLFPAFSQHRAEGTENGDLSRLYNTTTRYLLLVLLPFFAFVVVNAKDILTLWMGTQFASEGTLVLQILAVGALANFLARLPLGAIQAIGRPDVTGKLHVIELPIYLVLCVVFIPRWGISGAALACALRVWLDAYLMFTAAARVGKISSHWKGEIGSVLVVVAVLVASLLAVDYFPLGLGEHLGFGLLFLGLSYIAIWMFVLKSEDRPAIIRTLRLARQGAGTLSEPVMINRIQ